MTLYSLNNQRPAPLPFRIVMPDGFTRTDPSTFTAEEITAAGFTGPYIEPPYDSATEQLGWVNGAYVVSPLPPPPPEPRWQDFSAALAADADVNAMISAAAASAPVLHLMLGVGLGQAAEGDVRTFTTAWTGAKNAGLVSADLEAAVQSLAATYDLPQEFAAALSP